MPRPTRQPSSAGEFEDPLSNFEPREYDDDFERLLCETPITEIDSRPIASVSPAATVRQAMQEMSRLDVACLLIVEDGKLAGIFTERDVLNKIAPDMAAADQPVAAVMTAKPVAVYETDHVADALAAIAESGHRHVPVLDVNDNVVGVVSPGRINSFLQQHFAGVKKSA